jgi:peptide/nickel transport system substrate-binding protein
MTESRTLALVCICILILTSQQCNRSDRSQADKSTITIMYPGDEYLMGPNQEGEPMFMVFLPFVKEGKNGEQEGRLATSWEHSEDYRTWTIHLRNDVRWHDGVPVTAHDVKFTLDLLEHPDALEKISTKPDVESTTVLDDTTIVITYKRNRDSLDDWTCYYPKHLVEDLEPKDIAEWDFWKQPVGNGPYRYVRHVPKTMMELEANPDYYAGPPSIQRVVIKFGGPYLTELLSGNVDVIHYADCMEALALADDSRFHAYHGINTLINRGILWFQTDPLFHDARVRRALTLAIDRRGLLRVLNMPDEIPIPGAPYTGRMLKRGELPEPLPYDPLEAGRLLEEAGWRDTDADGILEKQGQEFRFDALVSSSHEWERMAVFIQDNFRRIGVKMDLQLMNESAVRARVEAARSDLSAVFFRIVSYPDSLQEYLGPSSIIGYHNPEVYSLLEQMPGALDPEDLDRIYHQLAEILKEDQPITFLMPRAFTFIAHRRLRGLSSPFRALPARHMESLWIEEEEKKP